MVAMERQLAACAARASQSSDVPPTQPSALDRQSSPLPPSSPQALRSQTPEVVVPARSPTLEVVVPTPTSPAPVTSHKHKDTTTHVDDLFNDDSPLTEEEQEVPQPVKRTRKGGATKPKKASTKRKSRK
jgi:hypothetical protein